MTKPSEEGIRTKKKGTLKEYGRQLLTQKSVLKRDRCEERAA